MIIDFKGGPMDGVLMHSTGIVRAWTYIVINPIGESEEFNWEVQGSQLDHGGYAFELIDDEDE